MYNVRRLDIFVCPAACSKLHIWSLGWR